MKINFIWKGRGRVGSLLFISWILDFPYSAFSIVLKNFLCYIFCFIVTIWIFRLVINNVIFLEASFICSTVSLVSKFKKLNNIWIRGRHTGNKSLNDLRSILWHGRGVRNGTRTYNSLSDLNSLVCANTKNIYR